MSSVHPAVAIRRFLARRPWSYWLLVAGLAVAVAVTVHAEIEQLRRSRDAWATTVTVLVASEDIDPGEPIEFHPVDAPTAIAPDTAATDDDVDGRPAGQRIRAGEIITTSDVARRDGPLALVPDGWRTVPIVESPPSGALLGERVDVTSDGVVIATSAVVIGSHDDVTLVAVPADHAPRIALATGSADVTLLRIP